MPNLENNNIQFVFSSYEPVGNYELIEQIWTSLLKKCQHSYFMSWGWISTWIRNLPSTSKVEFVVGYQNEVPTLAFFLGYKTRYKFGLLPSKIVSLNTVGEPYYDLLYIEYNSVLCENCNEQLIDAFVEYINKLKWDEFVLPGITNDFLAGINISKQFRDFKFHTFADETSSSFYVELQKIRDVNMDFLKLLSANKRSQVRRSIKQYELEGKIQVEEAETLEQALFMFQGLVVFHQEEWNKRGEPGVFSNQYVYQFHLDLIRSRFAHKEIQLLQIRNDKMTIGFLYCFVYQNEVLFYQCGFCYTEGNVFRPGLVSHYYAIKHNAQRNMKTYDFLAGGEAYKSSLSTNSVPVYWVRLMKNGFRLLLTKEFRDLKSNIKSMRFAQNKKGSSVEAVHLY